MESNGQIKHSKGKDDLERTEPEIMNISKNSVNLHDISRDDLYCPSNWKDLKIVF